MTAIVLTVSAPRTIVVVVIIFVTTVSSPPPATARSVVPDVIAPPDATIANVVLLSLLPPRPLSPCLPHLPCITVQTLHSRYQRPCAPIGEAKVDHPVPTGQYQPTALAHGQALPGYVRVGAGQVLQPHAKGVTHPHYQDLPRETLDFPLAVVAVCAILVQHHVRGWGGGSTNVG